MHWYLEITRTEDISEIDKLKQKIKKNEKRLETEKDIEVKVILTEQILDYQDEIFWCLKSDMIFGGK